MKSITMALAAAAALVAFQPSEAFSQQNACSNNYVSCVDTCVKKSASSFQERCIETCQQRNNECSEKIYGARPAQQPVTTAQQPREASEAMARRDAAPAPQAREGEPQAPAAHPKVRVPARQGEAPARQ
jgi:hypothetical protein